LSRGSKDCDEAPLDLGGAGLSIVGLSALVYGLIQAPEKGWLSGATIAAFAVSVVVLSVLVLWELRVDQPMLDMAYFRNPPFSTATGGMILVFLSMFGVMFLIHQYFQLVLGYSPLAAALRFGPMAPIMMLVSPLTPRMVGRIGANRTVATGMSLVAVGFISFSFLAVDTSYRYRLLCVSFLMSGIALTMSPMTAAIMSAVSSRRAGAGSAMNDATRELGAALGVAVLGSVAASRYSSGIRSAVVHLAPSVQAGVRSSLGAALLPAGRRPS
jgi:Na+/melibiose symporter-like transporter